MIFFFHSHKSRAANAFRLFWFLSQTGYITTRHISHALLLCVCRTFLSFCSAFFLITLLWRDTKALSFQGYVIIRIKEEKKENNKHVTNNRPENRCLNPVVYSNMYRIEWMFRKSILVGKWMNCSTRVNLTLCERLNCFSLPLLAGRESRSFGNFFL